VTAGAFGARLPEGDRIIHSIIGSPMYKLLVLGRVLDFLARTREARPYCRLISHRFDLADSNEAFDQSEWQKSAQTPVVRAMLVP
jgi:hypothetical protein